MTTTHVSGSFDVTVGPPVVQDAGDPASLGWMSLDKRFHGPLEATSRGVMLTAATESNGSRVYVALDRVTGTLEGRRGTFLLAHYGTMSREGFHLTLTVVPASGTDQLAGLAGTAAINIVDGKHFYELDYEIA